jgi:hypothetical protein
VIYLFTVACPERSTEAWWVRLLETERSYCFHGLTNLLEPEATHASRFAWLDGLAEGADFETAQRLGVLRGFPAYFERLWERSRLDGAYHIGNADHSVQRLLPGLWLLWPDMRFVFPYRDGIGSVDSAATSDAAFEPACHAWATSVVRLRGHQAWLAERGAEIRETRLETIVRRRSELRGVWTWLVGDWERDAERNRLLVRELESTLESPEGIWARWSEEQRRLFLAICGESQNELGYSIPRSRAHRRWWSPSVPKA